MRHSPIELAGMAALVLLAGCGSASHGPEPAPERVLAVNADGRVIRQSTSYEKEATVFSAPIDRVWTALQLGYAALGIQPTVSDRGAGRYGNEGFIAPRRMLDHSLGEFFTCGTGLGGPLIDQGRLYVYMVTTLTPSANGATTGATHLTARLQRNEGTSAEPIRCGSTGQLEEALRLQVEKQLAATH
jgi:hypothetical protein